MKINFNNQYLSSNSSVQNNIQQLEQLIPNYYPSESIFENKMVSAST